MLQYGNKSKKALMDKKETREFEQLFWDREAKRSKYIDEFGERGPPEIVEKDILLKKLTLSLGDGRGKQILDCGCGMGNLSIYLAVKGGYVKGFDISSEMVKVARDNANKNNTAKRCSFVCSSFEDLPYRDISFDLAMGAYILHHVNIERAVKELHRILKPGGKAVFIETWGKNPLLVWAGKYLAGRFGIAKYGTKYEHPITTGDIQKMRKIFSEVDLEFPEFVFFKKAATNVFRWKKNLKFITDVLVKMDDFITRRFPSFNKYGYYCTITLAKGDDEKPMARSK